MVVLGEGAVSYERGTPVFSSRARDAKLCLTRVDRLPPSRHAGFPAIFAKSRQFSPKIVNFGAESARVHHIASPKLIETHTCAAVPRRART